MSAEAFGVKATVRQAKFVAVAKVVGAFLNLGVQIILVRQLDIESYAAFALFSAAASVLAALTLCGLDRVAYRRLPPLKMEAKVRELSAFVVTTVLARLALMTVVLGGIHLLVRAGFGAQLLGQLSVLWWPLVVFCIALCLSDSFSVFCNSFGQQRLQSRLLLISGFVRSAVVLFLVFGLDSSDVGLVGAVFSGAELLLGIGLGGVVRNEIRALRGPDGGVQAGPLDFGFRPLHALREGLEIQLSYLLRIPFQGPFLRLAVGAFASPVVLGAFAFFQTICDRLYQFMPAVIFKGVVEPALTADFAAKGSVPRIALVLSVLLRSNLLILISALALLAGMGGPAINLITAGKFGGEVDVALLVGAQLLAQVVGEIMWIGFNPIGKISSVNRVWAASSVIAAGGLFAAYLQQSVAAIVLSATFPYLGMLVWMRYVRREPLLVLGLAERHVAVMIAAGVPAAGLSHVAIGFAGHSVLGVATAAIAGLALFFALIARLGIVSPRELEQVTQYSPRLAKTMKPLAANA